MYDSDCPDDWKISSVYDLAKWKNGLAFRDINFSEVGRPVIKIAELKGGITQQTKFTNDQFDNDVAVTDGDFLFSWSGNPDTSIDIFRWSGVEGWLNQHIFKVHPKDEVDREFFFFLMKWLRPRFAEIARNKQTTGLGHVTIADLKRMNVGVPLLVEQQRIVEVLGPIQQKLELNRRMNETLEVMARAIFKDWFVDFGPVRAKAECRHPPGLAPDIAALFPDKLDDEDKPVGWELLPLGEVVAFNPTERLSKGVTAPYLEMAALPTRGLWPDAPVLREASSGARFRNGDTLFARITPCLENGKTALVRCLGDHEVGWGSTEFIVLRPKSPLPSEYAYLLAREPEFRKHAIQSMSGTSGRQRVQTDALERYPVAYPPKPIMDTFAALVSPWFDAIVANERQSQTLGVLRDLLLPKLMSGEVRLKDDGSVQGSA